MKRTLVAATLALSLALVPVAASAHRLAPAGEAAQVARSNLTVTPGGVWNRLSQRPGQAAERWTLDGELLNDLIFFGGVEHDTPLFREVDRRDNPLPKFSSTMLPTDIPPLLETSLRLTQNISSFDVTRVAPTTFLGASGVEFEYRMVGGDDISRQGRAVAAVIEGKLYMITFDAPAEYFYGRSITDVQAIMASATLAAPARRRR